MAQIIIYPADDGTVSAIFPTGDLPFEEVSKKDVPAGKPYLVVSSSSVPDWDFQGAWTVDFSKPDGVGMGYEAWAAQYVDPESIVMRNEALSENAARDLQQQDGPKS